MMKGTFPYVGEYEGGFVYGKNIWRSEQISCMIDNRPYFSAWQRYLIVKRIFSIIYGSSYSFDPYETFLAYDTQYQELLNGLNPDAGEEGLFTTIYDGLTPYYNQSGTPPNYVEKPLEPAPMMPPPVFREDEEVIPEKVSVPLIN